MRLISLALVLSLSLLYTPNPISAHFFPNVTSIPPWLNSTQCNWDSFRNLSGCHAGEKVDGLSNLKKYFQYFGYINNASNFTDDFDEALKSAFETCYGIHVLWECGVAQGVWARSSIRLHKCTHGPAKIIQLLKICWVG